ncbi:transposon, putative [Ixodes scapularis]|uniref:Transposon, putative n=1 Tax=Ixodes scapularis TaxID=6945 RepID=B7PEP2_IXOSC|nr:transposon, putative [Ixodes scapularis]|eukprot:XP_002433664.1 transposon, putative [Ixodes scapularis]
MAQAQALYAAPIQYDPAVENWTNYVERLEAYFDASGVKDDGRKRSILISALSPEVYARLRSLVAPNKPRDETFDTIVKVLTQHLSPEPSEIYETFRFQSRVQNEGESVADYLAELRRIADHCGFGDALERNLRDRFVIGLREKTVQRILLAKPKKLTLKEALDTALAAELAMRNADRLPGSSSLPTTAGNVNALRFKKHKGRQQKTSGTKTAQPCIRCGDSSHDPPNCPHKKTTCFTCNKQRHLASRCFRTQSTPAVNRKKQQANLLTEEAQLGQAEETFHLMPSGGRPKSPAEMLLAYQPKVRLGLLTARAESHKPAGPANQSPTWSGGQSVFARNFGKGPRWLSGNITEELGNRMALVQTPGGMIRRHHDQLRLRHEVNTPDPLHQPSERNEDLMLEWGLSSAAPETSRATLEPSKEQRPLRQRRPPVRLDL